MTDYRTFYDIGEYEKPWTFLADARVNFISGGSNTLTGTQCPTIPVIDRGTNKFWNISYWDDSANKIVVHESAYNTVPNERLLITLSNNISLIDIDPVPTKLPVRVIPKLNQFDIFYNQNLNNASFVEALNHKNGAFNYLYRTWDRLSLSNIGRDSERYTTEIFPKTSSFTATATTRIVQISGGNYSISTRSEAYGGQFVGLNRGTASIGTADMSGERYVNTIMEGLSQEFIDISKFYKPTSVNIFPSPNQPTFGYTFGIANRDYLTFSYSSFFLSPTNNRANGIIRTRKGDPGTSSSVFAALDYYQEFNKYSYLEVPNTMNTNFAIGCQSGHTFNSFPVSGSGTIVTLDGTTTTDRSGVQFLTDEIASNIVVQQNNKNNKFYYKDLSRNPRPTDYQPAGIQRPINGRNYIADYTDDNEIIMISGGGCYNSSFLNNGIVYAGLQGSGGWGYDDIAYFESQYCDSSTNQWQRRDTRTYLVGMEKYTIDFWNTYNFEPSPEICAIKFYEWIQNGTNYYYGYLSPIGSEIIITPDTIEWTDEDGFITNKQAFYSIDITDDYNDAIALTNGKHNNIWIQFFVSANNCSNFIPKRSPVPYTCMLDNEQKWVQGYTLKNSRLEELGAYDFHFTPTINDPSFSGNINDSGGLTITLTNSTQPAYTGSLGYFPLVATTFTNLSILLDMDNGEVCTGTWSSIILCQEYGYFVSNVNPSTQAVTLYNRTVKSRQNLKYIQKLYVDIDSQFTGMTDKKTRFFWTKEYVTTDGGTTWETLPFFNRWE